MGGVGGGTRVNYSQNSCLWEPLACVFRFGVVCYADSRMSCPAHFIFKQLFFKKKGKKHLNLSY